MSDPITKVVVTNDDGIASHGLDVLARVAAARGWHVVVVAPEHDVSGASAAIAALGGGGVHEGVRLLPAARSVEGASEAYVVNGPPGLAALVACRGGLGAPPNLVLSGANLGANTGHAVMHSGTVGAALTAASFGVSAVAVSLEATEPLRWSNVAAPLEDALDVVLRSKRTTVLNLNVPGVEEGRLRGLTWARLDRFGAVRVAVGAGHDTLLQLEYRETGHALEPDSDTALLREGFATITAIEGIGEVEPRLIHEAEPRPVVERRVTGSAPSGSFTGHGRQRQPRAARAAVRRDVYGEPVYED